MSKNDPRKSHELDEGVGAAQCNSVDRFSFKYETTSGVSEWVWRVYAAAGRADRPAVYGWLACAKIAREAVFNGPLHKRPLKRPAENDRRHEPAVNGWPISPAGWPRKRGTSQR